MDHARQGSEGQGCGHRADAAARDDVDEVTDQAVNITSAVDDFMMKFAMALGVVVVSLLSLGWRVGIVVAAAIALTLAVVFLSCSKLGPCFDRITLGALILALGLLVDDAISPSR